MNFEKIFLLLKICGSVLLIAATFILTIPFSSNSEAITKLEHELSILQNRNLQFQTVLLLQGQTSILEELYALQANDMIYRNEPAKAEGFIAGVFNVNQRSIMQWASASMVEKLQEMENETQKKINVILNNDSLNFAMKRKLLDNLYNNVQTVAIKNSGNIQINIRNTKNNIAKINSSNDSLYILFVWMQIIGLILLAVSEVLDRFKKNEIE